MLVTSPNAKPVSETESMYLQDLKLEILSHIIYGMNKNMLTTLKRCDRITNGQFLQKHHIFFVLQLD